MAIPIIKTYRPVSFLEDKMNIIIHILLRSYYQNYFKL
jgi:hypothetical protein